ncbi:site-2 protease family protein [Streptomyces sp. NPDC004721]
MLLHRSLLRNAGSACRPLSDHRRSKTLLLPRRRSRRCGGSRHGSGSRRPGVIGLLSIVRRRTDHGRGAWSAFSAAPRASVGGDSDEGFDPDRECARGGGVGALECAVDHAAFRIRSGQPDAAQLHASVAPAAYAVAGVAGALLLVSLVVHEAAHALTARRAGIPVRDMTLWALGGLTRMDRRTTARARFAVAVSGPVASLLLGGAAIGGSAAVDATLGWRVPVAVLGWLGGTNLLLSVFNRLPDAPLEGGRVLQAVLWWRTRHCERAQRAAGRSRQVVGMVLAVLGEHGAARGRVALIPPARPDRSQRSGSHRVIGR